MASAGALYAAFTGRSAADAPPAPLSRSTAADAAAVPSPFISIPLLFDTSRAVNMPAHLFMQRDAPPLCTGYVCFRTRSCQREKVVCAINHGKCCPPATLLLPFSSPQRRKLNKSRIKAGFFRYLFETEDLDQGQHTHLRSPDMPLPTCVWGGHSRGTGYQRKRRPAVVDQTSCCWKPLRKPPVLAL